MSERIKRIYIKSFRGIHSVSLDDLLQINVLTGDNNCGKTSVLEVLESFQEPENFSSWYPLIRKGIGDSRQGISVYEGFYDLFDINSENKCIDYCVEAADGEDFHVQLSADEAYELMTSQEYAKKTGNYAGDSKGQAHDAQMIPTLKLSVKINDEIRAEESIYDGQQYYLPVPHSKPTYRNIVYISPIRHAEGDIFLSQVLDNPELYEEMLIVLKEFDQNILSINYDRKDSSGRGVYKILSKSLKKSLPLNMYGDGMKKAVLLMSAVIKAKNGILLLDEFETAIHTSAMDKVFRWILESCIKLNVQVFLTSHSKEAIDKLLKCAPELKDQIAVYTMYKDSDETSVRRLSAPKAIVAQDEMGLELR